MALGFDQALAEAAIQLGIPLLAYLPFVGQEDVWPVHARTRYKNILAKAEDIVVVCLGPYAPWKMLERNRAMVDACDILLALWNGDKSGGTFQCVTYAEKKGRTVDNCWSRWQSYINQV